MPILQTFGEPETERHYQLRPSVYAVLLNLQGEIAVVETEQIFFLPGGGLEASESAEAALLREIEEETGCSAHILWHLAQADQYVPAQERDRGWLKRSDFYLAETDEAAAELERAAEYRVLWLSPQAALEKLAQNHHHQSHHWIVERFSPYLKA